MELAFAYLEEVRVADVPDADDKVGREDQLNTLALATRQLRRAESFDPDAILDGESEDGSSYTFTIDQLKALALFYEGTAYHVYDPRHAVPPLVASTQLNPNAASAFYLLGVVHAANHNKQQAVFALRKAVELEPRNIKYRKELDRAENISGGQILTFKTTRAAEKSYDAAIATANIGIRAWNIFAMTYNIVTWPLRTMMRVFLFFMRV